MELCYHSANLLEGQLPCSPDANLPPSLSLHAQEGRWFICVTGKIKCLKVSELQWRTSTPSPLLHSHLSPGTFCQVTTWQSPGRLCETQKCPLSVCCGGYYSLVGHSQTVFKRPRAPPRSSWTVGSVFHKMLFLPGSTKDASLLFWCSRSPRACLAMLRASVLMIGGPCDIRDQTGVALVQASTLTISPTSADVNMISSPFHPELRFLPCAYCPQKMQFSCRCHLFHQDTWLSSCPLIP